MKESRSIAFLMPHLAAFITMLGILLLVIMIIAFALPAFSSQGKALALTWVWQPYTGHFGILPMLCASLLLGGSTIIFAFPLALSLCCRLLTLPQGIIKNILQSLLNFMAAIPTVVYGFTAIFLLTPLLRAGFGGSGFCWLAALCMTILLVLPTMVVVMNTGLEPKLKECLTGGLALGMTRMEILWFIILPQAKKSLLAATLLGFGRAIGDTLLPLMLSGNAPIIPDSIFASMRTLTAHMALVTANEVGGSAYTSLFAAGALLLLSNAILSLMVRRLLKGSTLKIENGHV